MSSLYIKTTVIGLIFICFCHNLSAQKQYKKRHKKLYEKRYEVLFYGGGGMSTLQYNVTTGKQTDGFGGQVGVNYNFLFIKKLALKTGVEFSLYSASFAWDNLSTRFIATDIENTVFEFRSAIDKYVEKQYLVMLQIPLMLQFQVGKNHQFYAAAGGKVGIPIHVNYNSRGTNIQNSGYYTEEDYKYTTQLFMGFGQFSGSNGKLKLKTAFMVSAEIGAKWVMQDGYKFYTGVYVDYGLNNIAAPQTSPPPFIAYNTARPADFAINGIFQSQYSQNNEMQSFTKKIVPMTAGLKLIFAF